MHLDHITVCTSDLKAKNSLPAGKVGSADEIASGYLFVIDNLFVTAAVIDIDSGSLIN